MIPESTIKSQIEKTLNETNFKGMGTLRKGKVRDVYEQDDKLILIASDRVSAFDKVLTTIPFKGEILTQTAAFWFELTKDIIKNHIIDVPDPSVMVVKKLQPVQIEIIVRGYITGSLWRDYEKETDPYKINLPKNLKKNQKFDTPIITSTTKADVGEHDMPVSREEIISNNLCEENLYQKIEETALKLFNAGQNWASKQGLILVDTKYEFGTENGELYIMDEIHTSDSSRYWIKDEYENRFKAGQEQAMLDKELIRGWLMDRGFKGEGKAPELTEDILVKAASKYIEAYERLTGKQFEKKSESVMDRLISNLKSKGYLS